MAAALPVLKKVTRTRPIAGRMRVILNVHGGQQGLATVAAGLVERNLRDVRANGSRPPPSIDPGTAAWKDIPTALVDGYMSGRTAAAWYTAELQARGRTARLGFRDGQPAVYEMGPDGWKMVKLFPGDVSYLGGHEGRTDERMVLAIDDDMARPVREVNQAIARHNAQRIKSQGLPPLYKSGVRYETEGSPELWWDAEEILAQGHDDCEGLAAYRAGELMLQGYDARVHTRLVQHPSTEMGGSGKKGGRLFHAVTRIHAGPNGVVQGMNGIPVYDDPSMRLGMPVPPWYQKFAAGMRKKGKEL